MGKAVRRGAEFDTFFASDNGPFGEAAREFAPFWHRTSLLTFVGPSLVSVRWMQWRI